MKRIISLFYILCLLFISCNSSSPRDYFEKASLNCNILYGFASYELKRDLSTQQEKLVDEKTMKMAPVTRKEVVKDKLTILEENYKKVKNLESNAAADEMIKASTALYEFVIPVYKNEYLKLAALYDESATTDKIAAMKKNISDKYAAKFEELYQNVVKTGTAYADKNGIEVRQVNPAPGR
jgi:hypothetical protein